MLPVTAVPIEIAAGTDSVVIEHLDGAEVAVRMSQLADYVSEAANPRNTKMVRRARVRLAADLLADGAVLVDTPGLGSVHTHNSAAAEEAIEDTDGAVLVLSAEAPLAERERALLHRLGVEALEGRMARFERAVEEEQRALLDDAAVLEHATTRLLEEVVGQLREGVEAELPAVKVALAEAAESAAPSELEGLMQRTVDAEVRQRFDALHTAAVQDVAAGWAAESARFREQAALRAGRIREAAEGLFDLRLHPPPAPAGHDVAAAELHKHVGRARWDLSQRLAQLRLRYADGMREHVAEVSSGVRLAVERARDQRAKASTDLRAYERDAAEVAERLDRLSEALDRASTW